MPIHRRWKNTCLVVLSIVWSVTVAAGDLYVGPNGDDGYAGDHPERAFRTIRQAAQVVKPGDTVHLAAGVYDGRVVMETSGTEAAPIVFCGPVEGEAVWTMTPPEPEPWNERFACDLSGQRFIVLEKITFRDCGGWMIMFDTHHCTIRDCVFDGSRLYNGIQLKNATYNRFLNCDFIKAIKQWKWEEMTEWCKAYPRPGADYIEIYFNSSRNLVEGCRFGSIQHVAVSISAFEGGHNPVRNIVRRCVFRDARWKSIGLGGASYNVIEENLFTGVAANFFQLEAPANIIRRNVFAGFRLSPEARGNHDYLNGVLLMASKIDYRKCEFFCQDNHIFNNLFYDNEKVTTIYSWPEPFAGNVYKNNIFSDNGVTIFLPAPDPGGVNANTFAGNVFWARDDAAKLINLDNEPMTLGEAAGRYPELYRDNIEVDPQLADPGDGDYRLGRDSPCIDTGVALTQTVGEGSGTELPVADSLYFCDGNGLIDADLIRIGDSDAVPIVAVDYVTHTIRLQEPRSWTDGAAVNLDYRGSGPDVGPGESQW